MEQSKTVGLGRERMLICLFVALSAWALMTRAEGLDALEAEPKGKTFIDYFLPTPIHGRAHGPLTRDTWGAEDVLPRDIQNGLEDPTMKQYCYWDGQIIKAPDGKYHMFASRWDQARGHNGWFGSVVAPRMTLTVAKPARTPSGVSCGNMRIHKQFNHFCRTASKRNRISSSTSSSDSTVVAMCARSKVRYRLRSR